MEGLTNGFIRITERILRFAYLNLLWVIFTLLGLVVFGFMPATTAMFSVVRKWSMGKVDVPIFQTFWMHYRGSFLKANLLGGVLLVIGYILYIEFSILRTQESLVYYIASFGIITQMVIYIIILMYILPIFVHFDLKITQYFKWSFIIGIIHPILTVVLLVGINLIYFMTFKTIPALIFLFGGSFTAFIIMRGASLTFSKFEQVEIK